MKHSIGKVKNNFVASVRVRVTTLVGIKRLLEAQGIRISSKAQVLSAGLRFMEMSMPEKYRCKSNEEAFMDLANSPFGVGVGKKNEMTQCFKDALEDERNGAEFAADAKKILRGEKEPESTAFNNLGKQAEYEQSETIDMSTEANEQQATGQDRVVFAKEGEEASVPGDDIDPRQAAKDAMKEMLKKEG